MYPRAYMCKNHVEIAVVGYDRFQLPPNDGYFNLYKLYVFQNHHFSTPDTARVIIGGFSFVRGGQPRESNPGAPARESATLTTQP